MKETLKGIIGRKVHVIVDRPLNSTHPQFNDVIYPINYGYIEGIFAGDGECQEGSVWEAVMAAKKFKLDNLFVIMDNNNCRRHISCIRIFLHVTNIIHSKKRKFLFTFFNLKVERFE